jgi:ElaB/YqjD/DUF883 family membrane-anchored ribosome-binding protein
MTTMDNNVMKKAEGYVKESPVAQQAWDAARQFGSRAANAAGQGLSKAADVTEDTVRKYPLAAVGVAMGAGVAIGALAASLLMPRPKTLTQRIGELEVLRGASRLLRRIF